MKNRRRQQQWISFLSPLLSISSCSCVCVRGERVCVHINMKIGCQCWHFLSIALHLHFETKPSIIRCLLPGETSWVAWSMGSSFCAYTALGVHSHAVVPRIWHGCWTSVLRPLCFTGSTLPTERLHSLCFLFLWIHIPPPPVKRKGWGWAKGTNLYWVPSPALYPYKKEASDFKSTVKYQIFLKETPTPFVLWEWHFVCLTSRVCSESQIRQGSYIKMCCMRKLYGRTRKRVNKDRCRR